jgi:hypothetical protein
VAGETPRTRSPTRTIRPPSRQRACLCPTFTGRRDAARNGITTFMEFGKPAALQEAAAGASRSERLGLRAYLGGPAYDSGPLRVESTPGAAAQRVVDEAGGRRRVRTARSRSSRRVDWQRKRAGARAAGAARGRDVQPRAPARPPGRPPTSLRLPIATPRRPTTSSSSTSSSASHRMTPVEADESVGLLGPDLTIGHGNLIGRQCPAELLGRARAGADGASPRDGLALPGEHRARAPGIWTRGPSIARPASTSPLRERHLPRAI